MAGMKDMIEAIKQRRPPVAAIPQYPSAVNNTSMPKSAPKKPTPPSTNMGGRTILSQTKGQNLGG